MGLLMVQQYSCDTFSGISEPISAKVGAPYLIGKAFELVLT